MRVLDIVDKYLRTHGYDGLYNDLGDCACTVGELEPCGEMSSACAPGHQVPCDCGDHDYHIATKP